MIGKLLDGISLKLNGRFGDRYMIYAESVPQGMKVPCFFVSCLNPMQNKLIGNRYRRTFLFAIQYHPDSKEPKQDCYEMLEQLLQAMEFITVAGDTVMGSDMTGSVNDGVLTFTVSYTMIVRYEEPEADPMEEMGREVTVKGK